MTGVWPRGAQVRRTTGSSETPDSSQNTIRALRRRAFFPDPGPVALHPPRDGLLIALDGAPRGALQAPAQPVAQQLPHVAGMVGDLGHLLDHAPDPDEGPVVGVEPVRAGALDRKSTRLNSSHSQISYAVFCLKKKKKKNSQLLLIKEKQEIINMQT